MDETEAELVRDIYSAAVGEQPWQTVVAATAKQFDASAAIMFTTFVPVDQGGVSAFVGLDTQLVKKYLAEVAVVDVWYHAMLRRYGQPKTGLTVVTDELVPLPELRRSRQFADYLNPMKIGRGLFTMVGDGLLTATPFMPLTLHRPLSGEPYSEADRARMSRLQPHLTNAMAVRNRLAGATTQHPTLAFERVASAVVVLARDRRVLLANPAAETLFLQCGNTLVKFGRLCAANAAQTALLERALRGCSSHRLDKDVALSVRLAGEPGSGVVARIAPCPASAPKASMAAAIVFLSQEKRSALDLPGVMATLYKLSPAEVQLVVALAEGLTPEAFAESRSVSLSTVRTQMRSVFAKTGSRSQADLMRLVYSVAH